MYNRYDVIVVGGGHSGIEAAHAAARMGSKTALITMDANKIGLMPCNPSIGGVGKGHIVFEISALGGVMPQLCTQTYLQARMLNTKKGQAVQGLRLQIDKHAYNKASIEFLRATKNLEIIEQQVSTVLLNNNRVTGIETADGTQYCAPAVVITTGTFLNGKIHIGQKSQSAGRHGEKAVTRLSKFLHSIGLKMQRLKTGTPPRLLRSTINFKKLELQETDALDYLFEFEHHKSNNTHDCYITHTNSQTHKIIADNLPLSPLYNGIIQGIGPRYCPSIEDKIARFADKTSHHIFVEPEGAHSEEVYPSGLSTSLPLEIQEKYIRSIVGFEDAVITKPGYAVEYDFVLPNQLTQSLEVNHIDGLFLAGQINGTTGYEEAAGQGIIAGINAHLKTAGKPPFILDRSESYIGVMIDDLVTLGVDEPYRMFTSRAERRLHLRQDNAFIRLTQKAYELGLVTPKLYESFKKEKALIEKTLQSLRSRYSHAQLISLFGSDKIKLQDEIGTIGSRALATIQAEICYAPYLEREEKETKRMQQYQSMQLPHTLNYTTIEGLSKELQEKLSKHKPKTIAQASQIPGITPAAISLLIFTVRKNNKQHAKYHKIV